jgi:hypothetical protein
MSKERETKSAASPLKVMKKAQMAQSQESFESDDTEEREMTASERELPGAKFGKKHSSYVNKNVEYVEAAASEEIGEHEENPRETVRPKQKKSPDKEKTPPMMQVSPPMPSGMILAHSYVPCHCYEKAFTPDEALRKGTLFPELWGVYPIPK